MLTGFLSDERRTLGLGHSRSGRCYVGFPSWSMTGKSLVLCPCGAIERSEVGKMSGACSAILCVLCYTSAASGTEPSDVLFECGQPILNTSISIIRISPTSFGSANPLKFLSDVRSGSYCCYYRNTASVYHRDSRRMKPSQALAPLRNTLTQVELSLSGSAVDCAVIILEALSAFPSECQNDIATRRITSSALSISVTPSVASTRTYSSLS